MFFAFSVGQEFLISIAQRVEPTAQSVLEILDGAMSSYSGYSLLEISEFSQQLMGRRRCMTKRCFFGTAILSTILMISIIILCKELIYHKTPKVS